MIRRISALSLAFLVAGGASFGADLTEQYRATADKLIASALADTEGYNRLAYLWYRIGNPGREKRTPGVAVVHGKFT